jgi:exodeoxyribonuclease VII small subunit
VAKKKSAESEPELCFEESLAELEQLVSKLEGGKLGLADSLAAYEQGVRRLNSCYKLLESAERRIELVQSVDANGKPKTTPLDDANDEELSEKGASRSRRRTAGGAAERAESVDDRGGLF